MKRTFGAAAILAASILLAAPAAMADGPGAAGPDVAAPPVRAEPLPPPPAEPAAVLGQSGQIQLPGGAFALNVPEAYLFYPAAEAEAFLQRHGAARPQGEVIGLVAPRNARLDAPGTWATVLSYDAVGYVGPDSAGLNEPGFEAEVRGVRDQQGRPFEGFAAQPAFDAAGGGLAWAERAAAPGAGGRDLRYEQRVLGRSGVIGLTSIGSADQMGEMSAAAPDLMAMVGFPDGQRYGDFNPASDAASPWTIPSLVTGIAPSDPNFIAETAGAGAADVRGAGGLQGMYPWIAAGVILLAGAGYFMMRRRSTAGGDPNLNPDDE